MLSSAQLQGLPDQPNKKDSMVIISQASSEISSCCSQAAPTSACNCSSKGKASTTVQSASVLQGANKRNGNGQTDLVGLTSKKFLSQLEVKRDLSLIRQGEIELSQNYLNVEERTNLVNAINVLRQELGMAAITEKTAPRPILQSAPQQLLISRSQIQGLLGTSQSRRRGGLRRSPRAQPQQSEQAVLDKLDENSSEMSKAAQNQLQDLQAVQKIKNRKVQKRAAALKEAGIAVPTADKSESAQTGTQSAAQTSLSQPQVQQSQSPTQTDTETGTQQSQQSQTGGQAQAQAQGQTGTQQQQQQQVKKPKRVGFWSLRASFKRLRKQCKRNKGRKCRRSVCKLGRRLKGAAQRKSIRLQKRSVRQLNPLKRSKLGRVRGILSRVKRVLRRVCRRRRRTLPVAGPFGRIRSPRRPCQGLRRRARKRCLRELRKGGVRGTPRANLWLNSGTGRRPIR